MWLDVVDNFVGDGLLLFDDDIYVVGAFNSHLLPSIGFFGVDNCCLLGGDDDDGVEIGVCDNVFNLIGTKALRISSAADSLLLSLGVLGGVRDGLFGNAGVLFVGIPEYSLGYFTCSWNGYVDGSTVWEKFCVNKSADGIGTAPILTNKKNTN